MHTYAVLGGTGATGSNIISQLLPDKSIHINIFVRSRSRLIAAFPGIDQKKNVTIFTGDVSDTDALEECVRDVGVVFMTVGTNTNEKGIRVTQDVAEGLIKAFSKLRSEYAAGPQKGEGGSSDIRYRQSKAAYTAPTVIFLASASISPKLRSNIPTLAFWILDSAIYYVYRDLHHALDRLREESWIPLITICPGGLSKGTPVGSDITLEAPTTGLTAYGDLAEGFIKIAKAPDQWIGKEVVVQSKVGIKDGHPEVLAMNIVKGLVATWLPWFYQILKWVRLV